MPFFYYIKLRQKGESILALFKVSKGASGALNEQAMGDGYCWFTYDDRKFYIDYMDPSDDTLKRKALNSNLSDTSEMTLSIPYAQVDATSTSTVFTATVPGITELRDGVVCYLMNGVVTSATNFTININGLGAKPVYQQWQLQQDRLLNLILITQ